MKQAFSPILTGMVFVFAAFVSINVYAKEPQKPETLAEIRETFKNPGRDYSTGPLWTWNDLLTEEQIRSTMQDMAAQHVKQVWVHPRPGLMTPYLSEDWFQLWGIALDEAEKLDMNVWIYDENSYPSGFAGGFVPEAMPESRGQGLHLQRVDQLDKIGDDIVSVFKITTENGQESFENVTDWAKNEQKLPKGNYLIGKIHLAPSGGWFANWWYVDLLKKGVTEKFIEVTLEPYRKRFGDQFGKRLPGWFTDEPHLQTAGGLTWNEEIPVLFEQKFGYSLIDNLPSMISEVGDWKKVRHDYQQLLLDLFIDRWAKPCFEYCEKYDLEFTGHYWEHGWPNASHGPDNMAMYAWHQRPSIDILMNQYDEGVGAQFGNARSVKEMSSVANQMGYKRTLSETYGAGGWDLRFEDMKRIADWQYALGVNTTNEHLSYVTLRGARKRDHPQSFSYHTPWWEAYNMMADYNTRISYALTRGEQINHVLVIEPTTTAWMYQGHPHLAKIGNDFQNLVNQLERWQVEYDLGSEDIVARFGKVENGKLIVGKRAYDMVILPPNMENINGKVLTFLADYVKSGGTIICCDKLPERVDGKLTDISEMLPEKQFRVNCGVYEAAFSARDKTRKNGLRISQLGIPDYRTTKIVFETITPEKAAANPLGKLFHHRRIVPDGEILFLCNTDIKERAVGNVGSTMKSVEQWNLQTGEMVSYPFTNTHKGEIHFSFDLPSCGSLMLFLSEEPQAASAVASHGEGLTIQPKTAPEVKRLEPNVMTIDYVDVTAAGETRKNVYTYDAGNWIYKQNGMPRNPWDNEVQFKDNLITKTFPADSGFTATYHFNVAEKISGPLFIVIERSDLYTITCNGKPIAAKEGDWWLDKAFGKIDITNAVKMGDNEVTITASPMTMWHELESAYLLGDFSLEPAEKGFIVKAAKPLVLETPNMENAVLGHSSDIEKVSWLSAGIGFAPEANWKNDPAPSLVFDLGKPKQLPHVKIWNYNEANLTKRGVKQLNVFAAKSPDMSAAGKTLLGTFTLKQGSSFGPEIIELTMEKPAQFLIFEIVSNHNGVTYPIPLRGKFPDVPDNAFVGLSEVKFFTGTNDDVAATVTASSELVVRSHDRKAGYLVDSSGLKPREIGGWKEQGMPFYSAGVAYTEHFELGDKIDSKKFTVRLGKWYGSVAKVHVNGELAGYIGFAPWELDVTKFVKSGVNEISVVVIGTPKNLLGPHHNGSPRGLAWPGMFQNAPADGPPSGSAYDFIGYGLFEPFTVVTTEFSSIIQASESRQAVIPFNTPDPTAMEDPQGSGIYVFTTGKGIPILRTQNLLDWEKVGTVFLEDVPEWARQKIVGTRNIWAPDVVFLNGMYHVYYSVSTFGGQRSLIGLAVNKTLDPTSPDYRWEDRGIVLESHPEQTDYNAIDSALFVDDDGRAYLYWGSYWTGIKAVEVDPKTGKPFKYRDGELKIPDGYVPVAGRASGPDNSIEAPYVVRHNDDYYLFVSWGSCCDGIKSTYRIMVGRGTSPLGPFLDRDAKPLTQGGGTLVIQSTEKWKGTGHNGFFRTSLLPSHTGEWLILAAYDVAVPQKGRLTQIRPLDWDDAGWPVAGDVFSGQ